MPLEGIPRDRRPEERLQNFPPLALAVATPALGVSQKEMQQHFLHFNLGDNHDHYSLRPAPIYRHRKLLPPQPG
ncbi:MAG: hypothetical protein AAF383_07615 [Cyanobacteria bacterium P01_A01_bin.83]